MLARAIRELRGASDEFRSTLETHLEINEHVVLPAKLDQGMTSASIAGEPVATPPVQPPIDEVIVRARIGRASSATR
jgi:hypothetical protein